MTSFVFPIEGFFLYDRKNKAKTESSSAGRPLRVLDDIPRRPLPHEEAFSV
jgi:hypothetical protein